MALCLCQGLIYICYAPKILGCPVGSNQKEATRKSINSRRVLLVCTVSFRNHTWRLRKDTVQIKNTLLLLIDLLVASFWLLPTGQPRIFPVYFTTIEQCYRRRTNKRYINIDCRVWLWMQRASNTNDLWCLQLGSSLLIFNLMHWLYDIWS